MYWILTNYFLCGIAKKAVICYIVCCLRKDGQFLRKLPRLFSVSLAGIVPPEEMCAMVFSSLLFLYGFFPFSLLAYALCRGNQRTQNVVLLVFL